MEFIPHKLKLLKIKINIMGFGTYYLLCFVYCIYQLVRKWNKNVMAGGLGISPGLDSIMIIIMAPILAPIDIFLTWMRLYKEAEEARRNQSKLDTSDFGEEKIF